MESQPPGYDPQRPPSYQPPPGPEMPPGGWQQPIPAARPPWAGPPLASWGARAGAQLLDGVVLTGVGIVLFVPAVIAFVAGSNVAGVILLILGGLAYLVAALIY